MLLFVLIKFVVSNLQFYNIQNSRTIIIPQSIAMSLFVIECIIRNSKAQSTIILQIAEIHFHLLEWILIQHNKLSFEWVLQRYSFLSTFGAYVVRIWREPCTERSSEQCIIILGQFFSASFLFLKITILNFLMLRLIFTSGIISRTILVISHFIVYDRME